MNKDNGMKEPILIALQGGYKLRGSKVGYIKSTHRWQHDGYTEAINDSEVLIDPNFWKALGKALGWGKCIFCEGAHKRGHKCGNCNETGILPKIDPYEDKKGGHVHYWHKFIDHRAEGKDSKEFFKNLLTQEK